MERSEKVFKEFISLCRDVTNNDTVVLELLQKRYNRTNLHFLWSNDFPDLVDRCSQKINADRDNKYVYIKEFTTELKAYKAKPLKHLRDTRAVVKSDGGSQVRRAEACPEVEPPAKRARLTDDSLLHKQEERLETRKFAHQVRTPSCTLIPLSLMCSSPSGNVWESVSAGKTEDEERENMLKGKGTFVTPVKVDQVPDLHLPELQVVLLKSDVKMEDQSLSSRMTLVESSSSSGDETEDNALNGKSRPSQVPSKEEVTRDDWTQRHIEKLELLLKRISDEIKRLQETELSLEDMDREDSSYTLEDRYKKRFVKVWNRLCQLKGRDTTTGREVERKLTYCGTSYPEVNKSISRFVNKFHVFPDYSDIHEIITRSNRKHNLGIRKSAIDRLAREAFTDVGNILQKRRMTDHIDNFGCHLTENIKSRDDPALFDSLLRQRLDENSKVSKMKLDEIISKYAQKQDESPGEEEEEEEKDEEDEEDEEEAEGEEEKKFMEDMEQIEEIVLTDGSNEPQQEEELNKENEAAVSSLSLEEKDNRGGGDGADIDLCTDKSVSESLSLLDDSLDELDDLPLTSDPMPVGSHSDHQQISCPANIPLTSVLSLEKDKATDEATDKVEKKGRVEVVEEESNDVSIIDLPLFTSSSAAAAASTSDVHVLPAPSRVTNSPSCISSSSDGIVCGRASTVAESIPSDSTSDGVNDISSQSTADGVEPVNALVPVATPIDVICLDDDTNSPFKKNSQSVSSSPAESLIMAAASGGGGVRLNETNGRTKGLSSSLTLGLVRLRPPCENVLRGFAMVDNTCQRKALSLRQPTVSRLTEAVTGLSSDEEDVVEILSIPAPNSGRPEFGVRQEVRSSVNTTQTASRVSRRKRRSNSTDECCIMTTVEESVVSTVVTSKDERSNGVWGHQQMEMMQHTKKTMRVVGQIVHFNATDDPYGGGGRLSRQKQQRTRPVMHDSTRITQMNQRQTVHSVNRSNEAKRPSGTVGQRTLRAGQPNRGLNPALPSSSLNKQLDDISSQIVSSIFKNHPKKKSSSSDTDVIICDDSSPSIDIVSPATTNKAPKLNNRQMVGWMNRAAASAQKSNGHQAETCGMVAVGSSPGARSTSSYGKQNGTHLPRKLSRHPSSQTLPEVIELS